MNKFDFDPKITEFSFKNALALAEASELAYESRSVYENILKEWGFSKVYPLERNETQGFVAKRDDIILLVFRGTEQTKPEDILTDVLVSQENTKLGRVHYGFLRALKFVWKDILKALREFQDNNQDIWIAGHSLGGALATLAAAKLASENKCKNIRGLYTYGKPRVGDEEFKINFEKLFKTGAYRITNFRDPVSIIPFSISRIFKWNIALQYHHSGQMVLFNESGDIAKESEKCPKSTLIWLSVGVAFIAIAIKWFKKVKIAGKLVEYINSLAEPHTLKKYIENIKKNINNSED
ncbi:MAG: lipase family protein [Candidatus Omnitrophica bacterium]|nr:lipase family protein [Candidatus Omnitrophota bacterium]